LNSTNSQAKYLSVSPKNNEAVVERYQFYKDAEALQNVENNLINATESRLNEFEQKEFQILRKYFEEGSHNPAVYHSNLNGQNNNIFLVKLDTLENNSMLSKSSET